MLRTIRRGVFETNSSSTHSLTMVAKDEYESWRQGDFLINTNDNNLISREDAINNLKKSYKHIDFDDEETVKDYLRDNEYLTYDEYFDDEYLEGYSQDYTSKNGDEIVGFGKYGHD